MVTVAGQVRALAAYGLPPGVNSRSPALVDAPLGDESWAELLRLVRDERIEGLLAAAVADEALAVTGPQHDEVRQAARGRASVDLLLERQLLDAASVLTDAKVDYRVLKGPAWARTVYPDPSWRGFGDVDLLVRGHQWERGIQALQDRGARRPIPELRPGFDRRFGKEATLLSGAGWEIDLHRTFLLGPFGLWVDTDELWRHPGTVTIGAVELPTIHSDASFLHACCNAALADDPPRLIAIRDVCQFACSGRLDPDMVEELARSWRAEPILAAALVLATHRLGVSLDACAVARPFVDRQPRATERVLMASYRGPVSGYTSQLAGVVAVYGVRGRLAYLFALVLPHSDYRRARGWTPLSHLRIAACRVVADVRRRAGSKSPS